MIHALYRICRFLVEAIQLPFLIVISICIKGLKKKVDVGLGPLPLINNVYHKKAISVAGYSSETFVTKVWHITSDFDHCLDRHWLARNSVTRRFLFDVYIFIWSALRYRVLVTYFNGGPFGLNSIFLWRYEPFLYQLAGVRTVILPYGADVQAMSRSPNLLFKHAMTKDYPQHRSRHLRIQKMIDIWSSRGDHIIGGCEWVDYMHHWDTLMLAHFSIMMQDRVASVMPELSGERLKLLHAPNHREIKGTRHIMRAVEELRVEGLDIELTVIERVPNEEVRRLILETDVVVDQLVVGWYAMFAIEAMASGKPVICHLRRDLEELYVSAGLLKDFDEIPIIRADIFSIKEVIKNIYHDRSLLPLSGNRGRDFVNKHHSLDAISQVFSKILSELLGPSKKS